MFQNQPFAVVENLVVNSACRGMGVGTALLCEVERFCQKANCSKIMLLSSVERIESHRFFEKVGFAGSVKKGFIKYRRQFIV
ncbi:MAG: GNAT family N-acetyltransferase [Proteobacteria bacterium]|nr:GNAT family N-acetyltransferase [Pseudomonadota bacterium]